MKNLLVLGGGTSGLISALIIKTKLPNLKVDIIKSDKIDIIGVGEGSTEHWLDFCNYVGITLQELLNETGATFKFAVYVKGWTKKDYAHFVDEDFHYLNGNYHPLHGLAIANKLKNKDILPSFIFDNKVPKNAGSHQFHFDTVKLNAFLIKKCIQKNINIIEDKITEVKSSDKIEYLKGRKKYKYDFYIDSTGFKKLLISSLGATWESYQRYLPMNQAIAFQTPKTNDYDIYTLSETMSSGWRWRIPTQERWGNGYVFNNNYTNAEKALQEAQKLFNKKITIGKNIKFEAGYIKEPWLKNCVAIGLSSSFVEPLEATSIGTAINQTFLLMHYINNYTEQSIKQYNQSNEEILENIRDFVFIHYLVKKNNSKFWKDYKINLTDSLKDKLEIWKNRLPIREDFDGNYKIIYKSTF